MEQKVFEQAGRAFFTTKEDPKKPGLGLALIKAVCRQHGGWLDLARISYAAPNFLAMKWTMSGPKVTTR